MNRDEEDAAYFETLTDEEFLTQLCAICGHSLYHHSGSGCYAPGGCNPEVALWYMHSFVSVHRAASRLLADD